MSLGAGGGPKRVVHVEIVLPPGLLPSTPARVVIQVEDVSLADAPSIIVAERRLEGRRLDREPLGTVAVEVPAAAIDPKRSYSVRVHVDANASGKVERGDLISTAAYPVLTRGWGDAARVVLRMI